MSSPFIGEICAFGFEYNPQGWLPCDGRELSIQQFQILYAVIGITYGGDGRYNFRLPNLQALAPLGASSRFPVSMSGGDDSIVLRETQMPSHSHALNVTRGSPPIGLESSPSSSVYPARENDGGTKSFGNKATEDAVPFGEDAVGEAGKSAAHENRQPLLALNFCICFDGDYPPRP